MHDPSNRHPAEMRLNSLGTPKSNVGSHWPVVLARGDPWEVERHVSSRGPRPISMPLAWLSVPSGVPRPAPGRRRRSEARRRRRRNRSPSSSSRQGRGRTGATRSCRETLIGPCARTRSCREEPGKSPKANVRAYGRESLTHRVSGTFCAVPHTPSAHASRVAAGRLTSMPGADPRLRTTQNVAQRCVACLALADRLLDLRIFATMSPCSVAEASPRAQCLIRDIVGMCCALREHARPRASPQFKDVPRRRRRIQTSAVLPIIGVGFAIDVLRLLRGMLRRVML